MKGKIIAMALIIVAAFFILSPRESSTSPEISTPSEAPAIWIEIHDASPAYGVDELSRVIEVLEKHKVGRVVIFVIPNHGGIRPLEKYPGFTDYLKELQSRGYEIGAHGYTHTGFEFYCSREEALERLNLSLGEFHDVGIYPQVFVPPRFLVKSGSLAVLEENFEEVYLIDRIIKNGQTLPYIIHEFTWFRLPEEKVMPVAKASYSVSRGDVYRLSVHMGRMDDERLDFLDKFLGFIDSKRINIDGAQGIINGT